MNVAIELPISARLGLVHSKSGQCQTCEADAEFLQRRAARDRLGQTLGQFIEFIVHVLFLNSLFVQLRPTSEVAGERVVYEFTFALRALRHADAHARFPAAPQILPPAIFAAAVAIVAAHAAIPQAGRLGLCLVCQPEASQRHSGNPDAEFLQCCAARDRLGQAFCEFIEFVVHILPFVFGFFVSFTKFGDLLTAARFDRRCW
jgi:hypothetical protein